MRVSEIRIFQPCRTQEPGIVWKGRARMSTCNSFARLVRCFRLHVSKGHRVDKQQVHKSDVFKTSNMQNSAPKPEAGRGHRTRCRGWLMLYWPNRATRKGHTTPTPSSYMSPFSLPPKPPQNVLPPSQKDTPKKYTNSLQTDMGVPQKRASKQLLFLLWLSRGSKPQATPI